MSVLYIYKNSTQRNCSFFFIHTRLLYPGVNTTTHACQRNHCYRTLKHWIFSIYSFVTALYTDWYILKSQASEDGAYRRLDDVIQLFIAHNWQHDKYITRIAAGDYQLMLRFSTDEGKIAKNITSVLVVISARRVVSLGKFTLTPWNGATFLLKRSPILGSSMLDGTRKLQPTLWKKRIWPHRWVISKFNGTSTPKGPYQAKTGVNCTVILSRVYLKGILHTGNLWRGGSHSRSSTRGCWVQGYIEESAWHRGPTKWQGYETPHSSRSLAPRTDLPRPAWRRCGLSYLVINIWDETAISFGKGGRERGMQNNPGSLFLSGFRFCKKIKNNKKGCWWT